ncbi:hypothetical protein B296_00011679 [Ensete ventricosum]|uniref:Uncharacterized protein n=1 Tax=Ensete ventricosum TaxID=4639 RepID=A0A426Z7C6_ENSVE|nr:hypothetical protein B296_00011679 [Ensete ventricosum]
MVGEGDDDVFGIKVPSLRLLYLLLFLGSVGFLRESRIDDGREGGRRRHLCSIVRKDWIRRVERAPEGGVRTAVRSSPPGPASRDVKVATQRMFSHVR